MRVILPCRFLERRVKRFSPIFPPWRRGDIVTAANEAGLRLVRFLWCGNDGTVRAKASALEGLVGGLG
jgi:hypothetical protein